MKISGIYRITNTITGDFYIGSSKDVKRRWASHKCPSTWKRFSNKQLYLDMQKYGIDKFEFQVIAEVEADKLKEMEQQFIEELQPTYNQMNAKGWDIEKRKEYRNMHKEEIKEYHKEYQKSSKGKESHRKSNNKYQNQLCSYNGEVLTLSALSTRFRKAGIEYPTAEAKKYLLEK